MPEGRRRVAPDTERRRGGADLANSGRRCAKNRRREGDRRGACDRRPCRADLLGSDDPLRKAADVGLADLELVGEGLSGQGLRPQVDKRSAGGRFHTLRIDPFGPDRREPQVQRGLV